ncbi:hypothetical protein F5Y13DRAFT_203867 [Hypoxylon sp. FL1857]|nr:hypothetical protein F5Y13DRAFT_203867 [Hypoxylon sp. FL1857]
MSKKRESATWFEALGGLSDYQSDRDTNSARSSVVDVNALAIDDRGGCSGAGAGVDVDSSSSTHRPRSFNGGVTDAASASERRPEAATASLRRHAKQVDESQARVIHRASAYEALTEAAHDSEGLSSHREDLNRHPQNPPSLHLGLTSPAPSMAASEHGEVMPLSKRSSFNDWKPQKPVYARPNSDWETKSDSGYGGASYAVPLSRYDAYRPPQPPPPPPSLMLQQQPQQRTQLQRRTRKPRPPPLNLYGAPMRDASEDRDARSDYSNATYSHPPRYADPVSRRGVQSSRIDKHHDRAYDSGRWTPHSPYEPYRPLVPPSPQVEMPASPAFVEPSRGRQMPSPVPSPAPSPRSYRSPSPSRGAWISDRPQQLRPTFLERAKRRLNRNIDLNLQRARLRPQSNFEVHGVQKSPIRDIAAEEAKLTGPTRQPTDPSQKYRMPADMSFTMEDRGRDRGRKRERENEKYVVESGSRHTQRWSEDMASLAERAQKYQQRQQHTYPPHETARVRDSSVGRSSTVPRRNDSLFLEVEVGNLKRPVSASFFASEWSQQQQLFPPSPKMARVGDNSVGRSSTDPTRRNSLFLDEGGSNLNSPASDSFFSSVWSQHQVIRQAQEMVASLPPSSPLHHGPFGMGQPQTRNHATQQANDAHSPDLTTFGERADVSSPYSEAPPDDRRHLPSQSRDDIQEPIIMPPQVPLSESPELIQRPPHVLARKKSNRNLRGADQ